MEGNDLVPAVNENSLKYALTVALHQSTDK